MSQDQTNPTGDGYNQMSSQEENQDMGGGAGVHGSGVAGGYEGSGQQSQNQGQQGQTAEKQDWLDKGIEMAGKKFGTNISDQNADKVGDFANKEFKQYEGRNIPGVQ